LHPARPHDIINPTEEARYMSPQDTIAAILTRKGAEVWSIGPDATVYDAIEQMADREIGCMPVVDASGALLGMISERDYARKIILQGRSSRETPVRDVMTSPAVTAAASDTVESCMRVMTDLRVRHLPVLNGGRLAGVVSIGDLVNWIINSHEQAIEHLKTYIASGYPG
jgi:CBS domain-containing protein